MSPLALLAYAQSLGVTLTASGDHVCLDGPAAARDELRPLVAAAKPELLALLREARRAEVGQAFAGVYARLSAMYPDALTARLWATVRERCPALARQIDNAERALDAAALAFVNGDAPTDGPFKAAQGWWERLWCEAIVAVNEAHYVGGRLLCASPKRPSGARPVRPSSTHCSKTPTEGDPHV